MPSILMLSLHANRSKKIKYIEENINAYKLKLSKGEIDEIRKFCDAAEIPGRQYGDLFFAQVYAETPALKDNV
jgi:diketogulonate reductase-like aldo/keto reductase